MLKYRLVLEPLEETEDKNNSISIDLSELDPNSNPIEIKFNYSLPVEIPQEDNIKFNLIGNTIKRYLISGPIDDAIKTYMENITIDEDDVKDAIEESYPDPPDPNRVSELDVIYKLMAQNSIKGYLKGVDVNGAPLENNTEISKFAYKRLDNIIVSGTPFGKEEKFEDTLDLEYTLYFDEVSITRRNGEYSIDPIY